MPISEEVKTALQRINAVFKETVVVAANVVEPVETISTGLVSLDRVLGQGGLPIGRFIEVYGPAGVGKTTLALQYVAAVQAGNHQCAYIDMEQALDARYAAQLGVKLDDLVFSQPSNGHHALKIAIDLVKTGLFKLIVVDSVASLTPMEEANGEVTDVQMGALPRLMGKALRILAPLLLQHRCSILFINQIRSTMAQWGASETTSGGHSLKFAASVRLDLRKKGDVKQGDEFIGTSVKIKAVKNKQATPFRETIIDLLYGKGFSKWSDLINLVLDMELATQAGAWITYKEQKYQGKKGFADYLKATPEEVKELKEVILSKEV